MVRFPFYARLAFILLAVVLVVLIMYAGRTIFVPLTFGLLIGILLFPLNRFFETRVHMGRAGSALASVGLFVAALGTFIYFLALQVSHFAQDFPELRKRFQEMFKGLQHWISYKLHIDMHTQTDYLNKSASTIVQNVAESLSNVVMSVMGFVFVLVFVLLFTFFILYHRRLLLKFVLHLFSAEHRGQVQEVVIETKSMINSYVLGLLIEMLILSIVNSVLLMIMGVQYAILLGVIAAVLNIIPYLGIYTSIAFTVLVTFANSTPAHAMQAGVALFIVHLLDSNILMPRIVGARVKVNPFITIIAVVIGEAIWGIPGMFLFIPVVGIMKLVCDRVEGLEAWGLLLGVEEHVKKVKKIKSE